MNGGEDKKKLVPAEKLDTVSPATRLLDKRRKMYENQEAYIAKKKHFTQAEFEFSTKEAELREEDHKLQQSLIQYATFLDTNSKIMRNCDINNKKLEEENKQRDAEIERKKKQYQILVAKKERIEQQKKAVEQYQTFLEDVKARYSDEYAEVHEIRGRYNTLNGVQGKLKEKVENINNQLEEKKIEVANYERNMETRIMSLNNDITNLTLECDSVEQEKSLLQSNEEESSAKKWEQISELSQVIFAIEMIEQLCSLRTGLYATILPYQKQRAQQKSFDSPEQCEEQSLKQLTHIGYYMKDFQAILDKFSAQQKPKQIAGIRQAAAAAIVEESDEADD